MARQIVVSVLERKYARLLGCQLRLRRPSLSIAVDLAHIEAVVRLFDPAWNKAVVKPIAPKLPSRWRKKGAGVRMALDVVKKVGQPLTATEIAHATYLASGMEPPSPLELRLVGSDLIYSLRRHFGEQLTMIEGRPARWLLVRPPAANTLPIPGLPVRP
jgi:hypothetical protein